MTKVADNGESKAEKRIPRHSRQISLTPEERRAIPPFATLRAFEAIGALGGIRKAASALSVDHASISRHLRALEEWIGMSLIDRTVGSGGQLTEVGKLYHGRVAAALSDLARATQDLLHNAEESELRLWCVPGLASEWLSGRLGVFISRHEDIDIEFQPSDFQPNFDGRQADGYIAYIIDGREEASDAKLRSIEIARPETIPVASPDYLERCAKFQGPLDLTHETLLHESNNDQWRRWFTQHKVLIETDIPGSKFWQGHLTLAAARRGQGIALTNILLAEDDLRSGRLVKVGAWQPVYLGTYVFTARRDAWSKTAISSFRRWLEKTVAESAASMAGPQR